MKKLLLVFALLISSCCRPASAIRRPPRHAEVDLEIGFSTASFWLFISHNKSLGDLIREAQFDSAVSILPERVWTSEANRADGPREVSRFRLIRFRNLPGNANADMLRRVLESSGCRAADVWDLLTFASTYPEAQRWVRVAALNTHYGLHVSTIQERYFYLGGDTRFRSLSLWEDGFGWNSTEDNWHFLVICTN